MANGGPDPYSSKAPNGNISLSSGSPGVNTASNFRLIDFESSSMTPYDFSAHKHSNRESNSTIS